MSAKRQTSPPLAPLVCINCGDELVIAAAWVTVGNTTGPICADCGAEPDELEATASSNSMKPEAVTPRATESKGTTAAAAPGDRAASFPTDPEAFRPAPGAKSLAIEVEEWLYVADQATEGRSVLISTPHDVYRTALPPVADRDPLSRFVVVLEWEQTEGGRTLRDIGAQFDGSVDRRTALNAAAAWANAEARRLKALGPYGYRPARTFEAYR